MNNDYEKQANDFLAATWALMKINGKRYGKHFPDDKQKRDIYNITLVNKYHEYTFDFGQSIARSMDPHNGREGMAKAKAPTAYDVLACLTKYEPGESLLDFIHEYGYQISTKAERLQAEKTYIAVREEYYNVRRLWPTVEEIDQLREIN
jgi:hypothetical protein